MNTSEIEIANQAPAQPQVLIRYDWATMSFALKIDKDIPINKLIGHLRLYAATVEMQHVASIMDEHDPNDPPWPAVQPLAQSTITMDYDLQAKSFTNRAEGVQIPVDELVGFLEVLQTALCMGPAATLQMQMLQPPAEGITMHKAIPPVRKLRR